MSHSVIRQVPQQVTHISKAARLFLLAAIVSGIRGQAMVFSAAMWKELPG